MAHTTSSAEYVANEIKTKVFFAIGLIVLLLVSVGSVISGRSTKQIDSAKLFAFCNEGGSVDTEYLSDRITKQHWQSFATSNLNVKARTVFRV